MAAAILVGNHYTKALDLLLGGFGECFEGKSSGVGMGLAVAFIRVVRCCSGIFLVGKTVEAVNMVDILTELPPFGYLLGS